ncbi:MAG: hypothetical protein ACF8OB_01395, partial [Phycisphaeraceae bacterium JB051]
MIRVICLGNEMFSVVQYSNDEWASLSDWDLTAHEQSNQYTELGKYTRDDLQTCLSDAATQLVNSLYTVEKKSDLRLTRMEMEDFLRQLLEKIDS